MKGKDVIFSHKSDHWETPDDLFNQLDEEFNFSLDPCATIENNKCIRFYTQEEDGLSKSWKGETVFINPPYSNIKSWVQKAYEESNLWSVGAAKCIVVMLLPARTDTKWFHKFVWPYAEIRFIKGRLKFKGGVNSAPFPSMLVIFR